MEDKGICLSLVAAAYQVEAYVQRCIRSVLACGYERLELILVMGRSTDRTNEICRQYAHIENVICIMQDQTGLSNARNCGILAARGDFVAFLDADDFVLPGALARYCCFLEESAKSRDFDALVNDFYFVNEQGQALSQSRQIKAPHGRLLGNRYTARLIRARGTFWNAWRYAYRREYLLSGQRKFAEGRNCEDLDFAVRAILGGARLAFCHMPYYGYCPIREDSLSNTKNRGMVRDFLIMERQLLSLCQEDAQNGRQKYIRPSADRIGNSAALAEKLKELLVLSLPDIYEVPRVDREKTARSYRKMFVSCPPPDHRLLRVLFFLCRRQSIRAVSYLLWRLKRIRRKIKYQKGVSNADYKDTVSRQLLRRRKRHGCIL